MLIDEAAKRQKEKAKVIKLSIASNATLVILKLIVGFATGLVSVIAEAMHSGNDLIASVVAYTGVRMSLKPADTDHQYGHGKIETITGWVENILILVIGLAIIFEGVHKFINRTSPQFVEVGIVLMVFSGILNIIISRVLIREGRELRSVGVEVDGEHLRADVITSLSVAGALIVLKITGWWWLDPVSAILVGFWVLAIFVRLSKKLTQQIIDQGLEGDKIKEIEAIIERFEGIKDFHKIRTRQSGSTIFVDMHIKVNKNMTIEKAHRMTDEIEKQLKEKFIEVNVLIHIEPYYGS